MATQELDSREQSDTQARDDTAEDHHREAWGKGLDGAAESEDDGTAEESAPPAYAIADASRSDRGD